MIVVYFADCSAIKSDQLGVLLEVLHNHKVKEMDKEFTKPLAAIHARHSTRESSQRCGMMTDEHSEENHLVTSLKLTTKKVYGISNLPY